MPLPFILGAGAVVAGVIGVGSGINGAMKMQEANETLKTAESRHDRNVARFESTSELTTGRMDELGKLELNILKDFKEFSDTIEKIQNRPRFKKYSIDGVELPVYDKEELEKVSIGASVILAGLSGAVMGTAGGFAASGATTAAVVAFGTASTGTAISSLSGAAAVNATLAALGGGIKAAGGGGIALGTKVLAGASLGVGLLVGGIIFNSAGNKMFDQANTAYSEMKNAEKTINEICTYLDELRDTADRYISALKETRNLYLRWFGWVSFSVNQAHKTDWCMFTTEEKEAIQNTVLLVGLLYKMCQVNLVIKAEKDAEINRINSKAVDDSINGAQQVSKKLA